MDGEGTGEDDGSSLGTLGSTYYEPLADKDPKLDPPSKSVSPASKISLKIEGN